MQVPPGVNVIRPNVARIYDYLLGGSANFEIDRQAARRITAVMPDLPGVLTANRAFLGRAVAYLADAGVRQFLDLGCGLATMGSVHEAALDVNARDVKVVYVDHDPVVTAHNTKLLQGPDTAVLQADLRDVRAVLGAPEVTGLLDLTRPVAVLLVAVLHFVPESHCPRRIVARYREALAPGSYLAVTHAERATDQLPGTAQAAQLYSRLVTRIHLRTRDEIAALLEGLDLVGPGLVPIAAWQPERGRVATHGEHARAGALAAVARIGPAC